MARGKAAATKPAKTTKTETTPNVISDASVKVYHFRSVNPFLFVHHVGVQFRGGKFSTTDKALANELRQVYGVTEIE